MIKCTCGALLGQSHTPGCARWPHNDFREIVRQDMSELAHRLADFGARAHMGYVSHGFEDDHRLILLKAVMEMGELGQATREPRQPGEHIPEFTAEEEEAADVAILMCIYACNRGLRLGEAMAAKHVYNLGRPAKHGRSW